MLSLATLMTSKLDQVTITDKGKLYTLLYAPVIRVEAVTILSKRVREISIQSRLELMRRLGLQSHQRHLDHLYC